MSGSSTFSGQTLASMGLTPGTYQYTWSSDSLTVKIGTVPEPSTWAMMLWASRASAMRAIAERESRAQPKKRKKAPRERGARRRGEVGGPREIATQRCDSATPSFIPPLKQTGGPKAAFGIERR
jgi:hypothetical protein